MGQITNNFMRKIMPLILGVLVFGFGTYMKFFEHGGMKQTEAVIERIDITYWDSERNNEYDVYVAYTVDGTEYHAKSDYYSQGYEEGKTIRIWYDPSNPENVHGDSENFGIYMMCAGALACIVGIVQIIRG